MKYKYTYSGQVTSFDKILANNWKATTYAVSEAKARSNFKYQFKTNFNMLPGTKVDLPGKIELAS